MWISLGGGGMDLPAYYAKHTGGVVSAAITRNADIPTSAGFWPRLPLEYSKMEDVERVEEIHHPIIREAMKLDGVTGLLLDIVSLSDIPAGTGLGSSGSFTTALLSALHRLKRQFVSPKELAGQACRIGSEFLKEPVGKQDQYIAAFGGITSFEFLPDGKVNVSPLTLPSEALANLEDNLLLFFTGTARSASEILRDQDTKSKENVAEMLANLHFTKQLGVESRDALVKGDLRKFAELMAAHWEHKKKRSPGMSNAPIDELYELARENGALGGKIGGAGGGDFCCCIRSRRREC